MRVLDLGIQGSGFSLGMGFSSLGFRDEGLGV